MNRKELAGSVQNLHLYIQKVQEAWRNGDPKTFEINRRAIMIILGEARAMLADDVFVHIVEMPGAWPIDTDKKLRKVDTER